MNQEAVHLEFHNYNWDSFEEFQQGLSEILESHLESLKEQDPSIKTIPAAQRQQLVDQAKSYFFCSKTGQILNLDDYHAWKLLNHAKIQEVVDKTGIGAAAEGNQQGNTCQEAPYSSNYQQLVELIVSGKPVSGIKNIPDTVLSDQKSESRAPCRTKPWAKQTEEPNEEHNKSES
ncbi:hypothetical protein METBISCDRAFT_30819 [Metschnikowia bicuspidata]|uniref:Uncharacterized protein n=1 Tax=Metschnikowia bicuspidata TaxID=27322 RepID=A0A4P9ZCB9_9ASCO|nr:hypothetical protein METBISCDRAFT_30819 [Metschnikowia bicuspidata]